MGCNGDKIWENACSKYSYIESKFIKKKTRWRWVAPIYSQAEIGFDYIRHMAPPEPFSKYNRTRLTIELPNLSMIEFFHGQHATSLEGHAPSGYVFDEAAKMHKDVYISAKTTLTRTKGPMLIISTPYGKNWFYDGCMEAKEHMEWAFVNNKPSEKIFLTARTQDNPYIDKAIIEQRKKELPARLFQQYYEAQFLENGSVFASINHCVSNTKVDLYGDHQRWVAQDAKYKTVVIGVDWAKSVDWTVFIALDLENGSCVGFERFHKVPYTEAVKRLVRFGKNFEEIEIVFHDKTGVGDALDDQLNFTPYPFKGIIFSNSSKSEMVTQLITSLEQKVIGFPNWGTLIDELTQYESKISASGMISYNAPDGKHDDCVSALLLANLAYLHHGNSLSDVSILESMEEIELSPLEQYYLDDDEEGFSVWES